METRYFGMQFYNQTNQQTGEGAGGGYEKTATIKRECSWVANVNVDHIAKIMLLVQEIPKGQKI